MFNQDQKIILNDIIAEQVGGLIDDADELREAIKSSKKLLCETEERIQELVRIQSVIGPSYEPEDVGFNSRCC